MAVVLLTSAELVMLSGMLGGLMWKRSRAAVTATIAPSASSPDASA